MGKLVSFLNNNWVAGIGSGVVVFAITSGLTAKLDRTTLALAALSSLLAGVAGWFWSDNRRMRSEIDRMSAMAVFDPSTGFFYWPTDTSHEHPLCPTCSGRGRVIALEPGDYGWHCNAGDCKYFRSFEASRPA